MPAVAITGLFCAGWVAGRGPISPRLPPRRQARPDAPPPLRLQLPRGRALLGRGALAAGAVWRWPCSRRSRSRSRGARTARATRRWRCSTRATSPARGRRPSAPRDINPLSVEPYFERAAIEDAAGNRPPRPRALEDAVRLEPASPEAWRRLGDYYVGNLDEPARAIPVLRAALFLDPASPLNRGAYLVALRARRLERRRRGAARAEAARRAARRKARQADASAAPATPAPHRRPKPRSRAAPERDQRAPQQRQPPRPSVSTRSKPNVSSSAAQRARRVEAQLRLERVVSGARRRSAR